MWSLTRYEGVICAVDLSHDIIFSVMIFLGAGSHPSGADLAILIRVE